MEEGILHLRSEGWVSGHPLGEDEGREFQADDSGGEGDCDYWRFWGKYWSKG